MKQKLLGLVLITSVMANLSGCAIYGTNAGDSMNGFTAINSWEAGTMQISSFRDPETGLEYLVTSNGGICPRYDNEGHQMEDAD